MMYLLAEALRDDFTPLNLFTYVTSRSVFAALTAMAIGMVAYPLFITFQRRVGVGQTVRDDGPATHQAKAGTPTMGGIVIVVAATVATVLWGDITSTLLLVVLLTLLLFAAIGLADDWLKLRRNDSGGLSMRGKLLWQGLVAVLVLALLWQHTAVGDNLGILVPYWKDLVLPLGVVGFFVLGFLAIVGASNAVNLTDGLDGLAILPAVMVCSALAVLAYVAGHDLFSSYLDLPNVPGSHELVVFCAGLAGAGLAFLWFNAPPAQVFMGDTGSLAIGAALGTVAVAIRQEIVFAVMSGLFIVEALSSLIQIAYFKCTGKRIFLMAPLHHHLEKLGWRQSTIVVRFWIITIILVLCGLVSLKIR